MRRFLKPHVLLIAFLLIVASIPLQLHATSQPEFCVSCHEMRPMVSTFEHSTHAAVGCIGCHIDPGYINFVKAKLREGPKDIYGHLFGYKKPIRTEVPNYRCLTCHPTIPTRDSFQMLQVSHSTHLARGIKCTTCHLKVGHQTFTIASTGAIGSIVTRFEETHRKTTLETCFAAGCHDNKVAKTACVTCHIDQQRVKPTSHRPGFLVRHGALARKDARDCLTCHKPQPPAPGTAPVSASGLVPSALPDATPDGPAALRQLLGAPFCQNCHLKANPHPKGFEKTHGGAAKAAGANCATCHADRKAFCDTCHKTPMPHPANFDRQHGDPTRAVGANCQYCHQQRECESCHRTERPTTHTAAFVREHGRFSKTAGANCEHCHQKRDCTGCHGSTRPATHTADFRVKHGKLAKARTQDCMLCHRQSTCNACHQLPMPHPPAYQANHTADARRSESTCANCHKRSYCLQCHEESEIHLPTALHPRLRRGYPAGDETDRVPVARWSDNRRERELLNRLVQWQADQEAGSCPARTHEP